MREVRGWKTRRTVCRCRHPHARHRMFIWSREHVPFGHHVQDPVYAPPRKVVTERPPGVPGADPGRPSQPEQLPFNVDPHDEV